jgi:uncharacterized protein (TIGR02284 family)
MITKSISKKLALAGVMMSVVAIWGSGSGAVAFAQGTGGQQQPGARGRADESVRMPGSTTEQNEERQVHVEELNELLRGVISAVETYRQALEKLGDEPGSEVLRRNLMDHEAAARLVSAEVQKFGGTPTTDSGAWGVWAKTVTGTAKVLGDTAALKALKEGEEHGLKEYEEIAKETWADPSFRNTIRETYIPKQRAHIQAIDELMERIERSS